MARKLHSTGAQVRVLVFADVGGYAGPARSNYEMILRSGVRILVDPPPDQIAESLAWCDAIVDGLLGTGLTGEVDGRFREAIELVNGSGKPVVAIDIPSGVDGDTGQVRGAAVHADTTITFGLPKRGNLLQPGAQLGGRLVVTHISFPPALLDEADIRTFINEPGRLPPPRSDRDDRSSGEALFIAGSRDQPDVAGTAALSMLRTGGGRARLAVPHSIVTTPADAEGEISSTSQAETDSGSLALSALDGLLDLSQGADFVVLGPGLSRVEETQELVRRLTAEIRRPLLIDGDGTVAVAADADALRRRTGATVVVLHPGELSRIAGTPVPDIRVDPILTLQETAEDLGAILVLRGERTLIGLPDRRTYINPSGDLGRSSPLSGEILAGIIAALHGLELPLEEAVRTGIFLHGFVVDSAGREGGGNAIEAQRLLDDLPSAVTAYREDHAGITADWYGTMRVI